MEVVTVRERGLGLILGGGGSSGMTYRLRFLCVWIYAIHVGYIRITYRGFPKLGVPFWGFP